MAAEIENKFEETSQLVQSSGGVFEVEYGGANIYSKKANHRFPEDGEVLAIVEGLQSGLSLSDAQAQAAAGIAQPPSFFAWLQKFLVRGKS